MWDMAEAAQYYRANGAPGDQMALISFLRELQDAHGGRIPSGLLGRAAELMGVKESFLAAVIRRIPSLRLGEGHLLELCCGPNCGKHRALWETAEKLFSGTNVTVKYVPCMRLCGKGPNLRWDGTLYHGADAALLGELSKNAAKK